MTAIRLLLVDDHDIVRAGIRALLHTFPGIEVVADTGDGRKACSLTGAHHPDVVLLDIGMPGLNGLEVLTRITHAYHAVSVIMLLMYASEEYVWRVLRDWAAGYLLKDADTVEFEQAIRTVARGDTFLSTAVSKYTIDGAVEHRHDCGSGSICYNGRTHHDGTLAASQITLAFHQVFPELSSGYPPLSSYREHATVLNV